MNAKVLEKYLRRSGASSRLGADFLRAVVIPACDELEELPHTLDTLEAALERAPRPVAVIVVVNHPEGAPEQPSLDTLKYLETRKFPNLHTLYAPGITGGVGRARKLGMDAFVAAHDADTLDDALIWSLDADTRVEGNYFAAASARAYGRRGYPSAPGTWCAPGRRRISTGARPRGNCG